MTLQTLKAWRAESDRPVAIFGAGKHTRKIMPALVDSPVRIACIADDSPGVVGRRVGRWDVVSTDAMLNDPEVGAILVSSDMRQEELLIRLRTIAKDRYKLLTIYLPEELSRRRAEGKEIDREQLKEREDVGTREGGSESMGEAVPTFTGSHVPTPDDIIVAGGVE
jgi:hypothetical protein